jgi:Peptidase family M48
VDAFTIGMDKPFIVLTSGLYDLMTYDEMRFVVGHELGHALSGHAVYRTMMMHLMRLARSFGILPVGGWALRAIVAALYEWQRKSELSGDRAGLLCCQDMDTAIRVEMKLAGGSRLDKLDSEAFLAQAREYERTGDMRDGMLKLMNLELQTHPFSVLRAAALTKWVDAGGYGKVMSGDYPRRTDDDHASLADDVGQAARHYREGFDQSDDPLIKGIRDGLGGIVDGVGRAATTAVDSLGRKITEWRLKP